MWSEWRPRLRTRLVRTASSTQLDRLARIAERKLSALAGPQIRVVNLHGTPARTADDFRSQVRWVARNFEIISPSQFFAIATGARTPPSGVSVLFTFDDGLQSNASVAAPLLEAEGVRGLFFVCPGFSLLDGDAAKRHYYERIEPETPPADDEDEWQPLSVDSIKVLSARGHAIGNHTWSHSRLSDLSLEDYPREIDAAAQAIQEWTGRPCESFAWTFAWNAINRAAHTAAARRHRFIFGACPGTNGTRVMDTRLIFRTHVEAHWPPEEYRFFYSGLGDPVWSRQRRWLGKTLTT